MRTSGKQQQRGGNSTRRGTATKRRATTARGAHRTSGRRLAKTLVEHDDIRAWAEQRHGTPAAVMGTSRGDDDIGMIRIDFPGYSGEGKLQPIGWDEWFDKFDDSNLALVVQEKTADGQVSHFNKLIAREGSPRRRAGRTQSRTPAQRTRSTRATSKRSTRSASGSTRTTRAKTTRARPTRAGSRAQSRAHR